MAEKGEIVILGAGPAGMVSAVTARKYYPKKKITMLKNVAHGVVPCGIPYMFSSLSCPEDNKLSTSPLAEKQIEVCCDAVVRIDRDEKAVHTESGSTYSYEKLILAVGADPVVPPIPGVNKDGIYSIHKDLEYLRKIIDETRQVKEVLIVGGGFIGIELADDISKMEGVNVSLVELLPRLLANSFDEEFSRMVEEKLKTQGVKIKTKTKAVEFLGEAAVTGVRLDNGEEIKVEKVILGIGAVPRTQLARDAGLDMGRSGGVWVDEYMRTSDPDIFAVGDCAAKRDFFTRKHAPVMLASTATAEARIAGANLYQLKVVRENKGTIAVYSTFIDGLGLGSAGLTEQNARQEGFEIAVGNAQGFDKHPKSIAGAQQTRVKLIFSRRSGILMGGQVAGGVSAGELINVIGLAIQQRISATELETFQMATHPCLTSAPTKYPIVLAAQDVREKM
ncbi:MAG: pyridine nucleotide-disulfide oxidoreductase [Candidatus Omnitrophica bacterium]|nr:pyridine nucleotide-disulfide oxidoreductase [Candidatus Omnitrophota bacterium]